MLASDDSDSRHWRFVYESLHEMNQKLVSLEAKIYIFHSEVIPIFELIASNYAISQSLEYSYAHHIQRLMVTGNFALLAGIDPDEVDTWYLGIYIDAFEWVEITNTRGMSQYADGGIVGSKPYISSASYIDKMSDYCKNCHYNSKEKIGEKSCPFNSLYWNFFDQHQEKLRSNFRLKMMYSIWDKMDPMQKENILIQADHYLSNVENL